MQQALFYTILAIFITTAIVTLVEVTRRARIQREHLKPLFASLILELVALLILLLSTTNFFGISTDDFIETLPERIRAETIEEVRVKIRAELERLSEIPSLKRQVVAMKNEIAEKEVLIDKLKAKAAQFDQLEKYFLVKMARLHADIQNYGSSVNILWNPEGGKRAICRGIQEALMEIGHFKGTIDGDPKRTHEALVRYQKIKGFKTSGYFSGPTLAAMIKDYLEAW